MSARNCDARSCVSVVRISTVTPERKREPAVIPSLRRHVVLLVATVALVVGACTSSGPTGGRASTPGSSASPAPIASLTPTLPVTGNTGEEFPELSVSSGGPGWLVELTDPTAKAWRIVVAGANPADRLELLVEVGDVWPGVLVTSVVNGATVDEHDLTQLLDDETAAAGGCHPSLAICYSSQGILLDLESGTIGLVVEHVADGAFTIVGGSAGWPGEPFVLGPWRTTAPFSTGG
jgi:hypothetical protein